MLPAWSSQVTGRRQTHHQVVIARRVRAGMGEPTGLWESREGDWPDLGCQRGLPGGGGGACELRA